jgi:hypothetical protein
MSTLVPSNTSAPKKENVIGLDISFLQHITKGIEVGYVTEV